MKTKYHIEITRKVLSSHFSTKAVDTIIRANIRQDRLAYMLGHDYIHFDGSAFEEGFSYLEDQKTILIEAIDREHYQNARKALGRMTHSWQDFYSHSNYVKIWRSLHPGLSSEDILPNELEIMEHPELLSGKNYGLIEFLAMIPGLSKIVLPKMPPDSHAIMNLDGPETGPLFEYAYQVAIKQTQVGYQRVLKELSQKKINAVKVSRFHDLITH